MFKITASIKRDGELHIRAGSANTVPGLCIAGKSMVGMLAPAYREMTPELEQLVVALAQFADGSGERTVLTAHGVSVEAVRV